ncbi:MAG: aminopeptidase N [Paracoccaceae bacterium]
MAKDIDQTIYLKDYTPPAYLIDKTELVFHLDPTKTRVVSRIAFRPNPDAKTNQFILDGAEMKLVWAKINGAPVSPNISDTYLDCVVPNAPFIWEAEVEINPSANTALEGLYMSNGMYCTQCEAEGFRKITYYPDRPDVLAKFDVRIHGDHPVLLSNGNLISSETGSAEWHDPWPKPAYLFALVAGELFNHQDRFTTQSGRDVELNIWVRDGDQDKCEFGMQALKASMDWDERVYGREYDLDVFNIVAVDDFNMGAMENKGLNIFNSTYILANNHITTDTNFELIEAVIAHEYFHNWTGNRITCRDWFQLCLKEGLTVFRDSQFTADMRSAPVKRIGDAFLMRSRQFREDAGPLAHPVRPESFVEINNFYTLTVYEKGAELIRMLKTLVGDAAYYKSVERYFDQHDGQAATIEDWLAAFEDTTGRDLSQFKLWYQQAGTPQVKVSETFENGCFELTFEQSTAPTPGQPDKPNFVIPLAVGLLDQSGAEIQPTQIFELTEKSQTLRFDGLTDRPIPSILREFSAPVLIDHAVDRDRLSFLMSNDTDPYSKWDAAQTLMMDVTLSMLTDGAAVDERLLSGLRDVAINAKLDPAFRALTLTQPARSDVMQRLYNAGTTPDPFAIHAAQETISHSLAEVLQNDLGTIYVENQVRAPFAPTAEQAGQRALANMILGLITRLDGGTEAREQFETADNMTSTLGALGELLSCEYGVNAAQKFYETWKHERLVIDKWFSIQMTHAKPEEALDVVDRLSAHPDFSIKNPNRFRSVFGPFAGHAGFHASDGLGYDTLADWLIKLDKINPQPTARSCSAFDSWRIFAPDRQTQMQTAMKRILDQEDLSRDTREMLTRILGEDG